MKNLKEVHAALIELQAKQQIELTQLLKSFDVDSNPSVEFNMYKVDLDMFTENAKVRMVENNRYLVEDVDINNGNHNFITMFSKQFVP